jgi:hypothetical protein
MISRVGAEKRKIRTDKKWAIAPFIPDEQRVWIHRLASRSNLPEGVVGEQLLRIALQDESCIVFFSSYLRRDFCFRANITYCGHKDARSIYEYISNQSERGRYKIKASQTLYDQLCEFQIALGVSYLAHATYALLKYALHDIKILQMIVPGITKEELTGPSKPVALSEKSSAWSILK